MANESHEGGERPEEEYKPRHSPGRGLVTSRSFNQSNPALDNSVANGTTSGSLNADELTPVNQNDQSTEFRPPSPESLHSGSDVSSYSQASFENVTPILPVDYIDSEGEQSAIDVPLSPHHPLTNDNSHHGTKDFEVPEPRRGTVRSGLLDAMGGKPILPSDELLSKVPKPLLRKDSFKETSKMPNKKKGLTR